MLSSCPIKIPKSGKSLYKISGVTLFLRSIGRLTEVYETSSKLLIMVTAKDNQYILEKCLQRIDEIKAIVDESND